MHEEKKQLRALLSALISEREDSQLLYIPSGEPGMRRMIRALLDMRTPRDDDPLAEMIRTFLHEQ
ncbi:MAG: hypothetical protein IJ313_00085 [Clostridia bacterium]|nr:hypothetical protein [Clostridia bacterium]